MKINKEGILISKSGFATILLMIADFAIVFVMYLLGYLASFTPITWWTILFVTCVDVVFIIAFYLLGLYKTITAHLSIKDEIRIALGVGVANVIVKALMFIHFFDPVGLRVWVMALITLGQILCFIGVRLVSRVIRFYSSKNNGVRTMIIGAGSAGKMVYTEYHTNPKIDNNIVCYLDDDKQKIGKTFLGSPVCGPIDNAKQYIEKYDVKEVVVAIAGLSKKRYEEILNVLKECNVIIKRTSLLSEISDDNQLKIKEVSIEELLGRDQITVIDESTKEFYKDKVVLVTGGGGSIGSELCRQLATMSVKQIIILDIYENCAYDVQQELKMKYGDKLDLKVEIISICNKPALERVFIKYKPNIVVMAAAHKHVPLMENNVIEAVENNVFGTLNTVELSEKYNVDRVHMVSTDKAVNPTSVMGATKRICEYIVMSHSKIKQHTTFSITRFGNVLGSAGSVIPLFKRQIASGGPITLTDFRIIRYFMTIPEASQLVLTSASMAKNGELFVLDMGQPVKIYDLAINMIRLSGLVPNKDIEIKEIGLRPGEKLYEELLVKSEELDKTNNKLIFIERDTPISIDELDLKLSKLNEGILKGDDKAMKDIIKSVVPTFIEKEVANKDFNGKEVK